ncbi:TIR domain-containing protein [Anaerolineae bacterium CFX9]|nr:TIR domain-containing protein [Anaerolineae bacterium CFX9]
MSVESGIGQFEVYNPESMSLGTNWIQALEDAIREVTDTGIFVTLISKTSLRNDFWLKELTFAQENHGLVLPVIIEPIDKTAIPSHLQRIQWLDVSNEDNPYKMIEQILSAITRIRHEDFVRTCGRIIT